MNLPPSWKAEIEEAVQKTADASGERQKAENEKNSTEIASAIQRFVDTYNTQHDKPERKDQVKRLLDIATVVLLFGTALFTGLGWLVFRDQLGEMKRAYGPIETQAAAAKSAADAATRNVDVLVNSERARFVVNALSLSKAGGDNDPHPQIVYSFANLGRGLGVVTEMMFDCPIVSDQINMLPPVNSSKIRRGESAIASGAIFPSTSIPIAPCVPEKTLNADDWTAINKSKEFILFTGYIRYRDSFRKYKWQFGSLYVTGDSFFSTNGLPPAYNEETEDKEP